MSKNTLFTADQYNAIRTLTDDDRLRGLLLGFARGKSYHDVENRVGAWNVFNGPNDTRYRLIIALAKLGFDSGNWKAIMDAFFAWSSPDPTKVVPCNRKFYRRTDPRHPGYNLTKGATAEQAVAVACETLPSGKVGPSHRQEDRPDPPCCR